MNIYIAGHACYTAISSRMLKKKGGIRNMGCRSGLGLDRLALTNRFQAQALKLNVERWALNRRVPKFMLLCNSAVLWTKVKYILAYDSYDVDEVRDIGQRCPPKDLRKKYKRWRQLNE